MYYPYKLLKRKNNSWPSLRDFSQPLFSSKQGVSMQESMLNFEASNETELLQSLELMDINVPLGMKAEQLHTQRRG